MDVDYQLFRMRALRFIKEHCAEREAKMRDMFLKNEELVADGVDLMTAIKAQHFAYGNVFGIQEEFTVILEEAKLS
jgi:hypothetical protein